MEIKQQRNFNLSKKKWRPKNILETVTRAKWKKLKEIFLIEWENKLIYNTWFNWFGNDVKTMLKRYGNFNTKPVFISKAATGGVL